MMMTILICKIIQNILNLFGRGSAYPGDIAIKLNKNILSYFKLPEKTIFITGTTGKTSVTGMISATYERSGFKVCSNVKGSNLMSGVVSAFLKDTKLNGKLKSEIVIIEIDERYVKKVFEFITPNYFIINNLSRDQLARNGHPDVIIDEIRNCLKDTTHLILNADDPLVNKIVINKKNKITYYGLSKNIFSTTDNELTKLDMRYCPICNKKLRYSYFNYASLGDYKCPNKDFYRPNVNYEAHMIDEETLKVENIKIKLHNKAIYNMYNLLACYTACRVLKMKKKEIEKNLKKLSLKVERIFNFKIKDIDGQILLSKNETPISYNQSLNIVNQDYGKKTVAIGFNRISGRYDLKDISWLYDINFEMLNNEKVEKIILLGPFAYDIAVRLKLANVDTTKIIYCLNQEDILNTFLKEVTGKLYCVVYFDLDKKIKKQLKESGELL